MAPDRQALGLAEAVRILSQWIGPLEGKIMQLRLTVNRARRVLDVPHDTTLLVIFRDGPWLEANVGTLNRG